jgi:hypothetical protein
MNPCFHMLDVLRLLMWPLLMVQVLLEIQDTLKQPPKAEKTMGGAVKTAVTAAFAFYFSTAVACYSALGNDVPGEVLQGFEREMRGDLLDCAGTCVHW